jgi:hypothetical protein
VLDGPRMMLIDVLDSDHDAVGRRPRRASGIVAGLTFHDDDGPAPSMSWTRWFAIRSRSWKPKAAHSQAAASPTSR